MGYSGDWHRGDLNLHAVRTSRNYPERDGKGGKFPCKLWGDDISYRLIGKGALQCLLQGRKWNELIPMLEHRWQYCGFLSSRLGNTIGRTVACNIIFCMGRDDIGKRLQQSLNIHMKDHCAPEYLRSLRFESFFDIDLTRIKALKFIETSWLDTITRDFLGPFQYPNRCAPS